jgi:hypothetical protein
MQPETTTIPATTTPNLTTTTKDLKVDVKIEETKAMVMQE